MTLINKTAATNLATAWGKPITVGTNILDFIPDENEEPIRKSLDKVFAGEKVEYELHLSFKGLPSWVSVIYMPVRDENNIVAGAYIATKDITKRKKAEQELEASYQSVRQLTDHLQNIREEERTSIAREIHDELGQQLTVIIMDVAWLDKKIGNDNTAVKEKIKELAGLLEDTIKTVRKISTNLRPSVLDDMGLEAAMEMYLQEF